MKERSLTCHPIEWYIGDVSHFPRIQDIQRLVKANEFGVIIGKAIEDLWKDANPGLPGVEDARKRMAGL